MTGLGGEGFAAGPVLWALGFAAGGMFVAWALGNWMAFRKGAS